MRLILFMTLFFVGCSTPTEHQLQVVCKTMLVEVSVLYTKGETR
jgi:hypothetical protein